MFHNNNPPARITAREATEQKLNILLEWPYVALYPGHMRMGHFDLYMGWLGG